jgi:hypothetical protein
MHWHVFFETFFCSFLSLCKNPARVIQLPRALAGVHVPFFAKLASTLFPQTLFPFPRWNPLRQAILSTAVSGFREPAVLGMIKVGSGFVRAFNHEALGNCLLEMIDVSWCASLFR